MNITDTLIYLLLCSLPIAFMFVMITMLRKDVKDYREALKAYLEESVDDGYNDARRKNVRDVSKNGK